MKTEAEIKVALPQVRDYLGLPELEETRKGPSLGALEIVAQPISGFWTSGLQNFLENRFLMFKTK